MLHNESIKLRALEPEDLEFLYKIENEPYMWILSSRKEPYSRYSIKEYIAHCDKTVFERGQLRFIISENHDDSAIGTIDIFDFDLYNKKAEIGIFVDNNYRRKSYAKQAIEILISYAKDYLGIHQLYAYIDKDNIASVKTFISAGFTKTATLKEWLLIDGIYKDICLYQKFI